MLLNSCLNSIIKSNIEICNLNFFFFFLGRGWAFHKYCVLHSVFTWQYVSRLWSLETKLAFFFPFSEESNKKHPFPCPTTYRTALTHYLDITNPPRTNVLYELAQYASDPKEQENMRKMASSSAEGKACLHFNLLLPTNLLNLSPIVTARFKSKLN